MKKIRIIGVPIDFGQTRRGVDMGSAALRYSGLVKKLRKLGYEVEDSGDVQVPVRKQEDEQMDGSQYKDEIVEVCKQVYNAGKSAMDDAAFPLFLGGDHSIAIGTVAGITENKKTGIIWIDAHGDFNTTETSPSGNIHGMPLAVLAGDGDSELVNIGRKGRKILSENVALIGIRSLDYEERRRLKESGVKVYTMREIDEQGISTVIHQVLDQFSELDYIHVSLDMDALDPREAPGVGTPVPGGLTYREAHLLMEILADSGRITSMDIVEINPILDKGNTTAELAVDLTISALGKRIF